MPGPTREFPLGKLNDTDRGELVTEIREEDGRLVVDFGTDLSWIGFEPQGAVDFAYALIDNARATGVPLKVRIE